jgi:hypothetical protein
MTLSVTFAKHAARTTFRTLPMRRMTATDALAAVMERTTRRTHPTHPMTIIAGADAEETDLTALCVVEAVMGLQA